MLDILFILPPIVGAERSQVPPLGLGYLAGMVKDRYSVKIIDMAATKMKKNELIQILEENRPKIVGISSLVNVHKSGCKVARIVKEVLGGEAMVAMGGPHVTFLAEETLTQVKEIDVIVLGEGEYTFLELVRHRFAGNPEKLEDIAGIVFRKGNDLIFTKKRSMIKELDQVPFPARELMDISLYQESGTIITGRGCPFVCKFCASSSLCGRKFRARSAKNVLAEIDELYNKFQIKRVYFADDTFVYNQKRTQEICSGLIERNYGLIWGCGTRVDCVPQNSLELMYRAGCKGILLGIESGDEKVLKNIGKGISLELILDAARRIHDIGMQLTCSFILGLPEDTEESLHRTFDLIHQLRELKQSPTEADITIYFSILTPLPGTEFYDRAEDFGIEILTKDWDRYTFMEPVINTEHFTQDDLRELFFAANAPVREMVGDQ